MGTIYQLQVCQIPDDLDGETVCGDSDPINLVIRINEKLDDHMKLNTLIHEITHQILAISGLHNLIDGKLEEAICDTMGSGFASVLKENDTNELQD